MDNYGQRLQHLSFGNSKDKQKTDKQTRKYREQYRECEHHQAIRSDDQRTCFPTTMEYTPISSAPETFTVLWTIKKIQ